MSILVHQHLHNQTDGSDHKFILWQVWSYWCCWSIHEMNVCLPVSTKMNHTTSHEAYIRLASESDVSFSISRPFMSLHASIPIPIPIFTADCCSHVQHKSSLMSLIMTYIMCADQWDSALSTVCYAWTRTSCEWMLNSWCVQG